MNFMGSGPKSLLRIAALSAWALAGGAHADWVSLSGAENAANIAEFYIEEDRVEVRLEIFVEDVMAFDRLIPDEFLEGIERPALEERLRAFAAEDLQVIADGGRVLEPTLVRFETRLRTERPSPNAGKLNPYTLTIIPGPPEDKRGFYAELVYPLEQRPATLTFVPPLDEGGYPEVPIGFIAYHEGVPLIDFRYLPVSSQLTLDWTDPWYSVFEHKGLKRWQRGSLVSFLYIEPLDVRHVVLVRVKEFEAWMDLGLRGDEYIEADENEPFKRRVAEFFLEHDTVTIDGEQVVPFLDRTAFVKYSMTGSTFLQQPERLPINTATVGVILTFPTDRIPREVSMEWNLWSERIRRVPTDAIDPAGPFPAYVTSDDNVQVWKNFLKTYEPPTVMALALDESLTRMQLPLVSLLCLAALVPLGWLVIRSARRGQSAPGLALLGGGMLVAAALSRPLLPVSVARPNALAPELTQEQAMTVLDDLLRNVYRSFDFSREEDVYDRLATSVAGELLSDVYLENRRSLEVTQAGGAQARVQEVEILEAMVERRGGSALAMTYRARWTAQGSVSHWGHLHTRKNLYEADITVEPVDGSWKITKLELLNEERIDANAPRTG